MDPRIGFIGLGKMGKWMAFNLVRAGFDVTVYDVSEQPVAFLLERGAKAVNSPAALARKIDWLFLCLPSAFIVEQVLFGEGGVSAVARPGMALVDCGTTSYLATLDFEQRLKPMGVRYADAPVSGRESRAEEGTLTMMFGGAEPLFQEVYPALAAMGNEIVYMGEIGSGQLTKLINQLLYNINAAAIAEVFPLAAKLGLDPEKVVQVVTAGTGKSAAVDYFGPLILEGRFDQGYPLQDAYKDMISATELSAQKKIPLPLVHAATTTYQMALAEGLGAEGKGAMIKVFERLLGVEFRKKTSTTIVD